MKIDEGAFFCGFSVNVVNNYSCILIFQVNSAGLVGNVIEQMVCVDPSGRPGRDTQTVNNDVA
ncbi:hypothetical protein Lfee_1392 [Legionella feeleii]|uniref:Uncharacterized protein n=1 Tax=Legionella feeleii TaxID=453 RepID=A0A0W0TV29_9GAMM|nr:hypothetical protein [Legionella feeleii]KTC99226.1 hypothetical protein Lfee_1392 [Legionella feeleii]SPX61081.1 Uncharacterised protein [Legionella feeleii]